MYPGFNIREYFKHDANLPDARWLTQVARWIGNLWSSDGSVIVSPSVRGINLQVNPAAFSGTMAGGGVFAKVTSWTGAASTCTADIYANGPTQAATQTGATVHFYGSSGTVPPANTVWLQVRQTAGETSPQEWDGIPVRIGTDYVAVCRYVEFSGGYLRYMSTNLSFSFNSAGQLIPSLNNPGSTTAILEIDTTTEIDLAPQSQLSGGYLQTRCKKIKFYVTSDTVPVLQLAASSNYGDWVSGPAQTTCS